MIEAPYRKDKPYDEFTEKTVNYIREHIQSKDDDYVTLIVGSTGGGKSTVALHMLDIFMPEDRIDINQIALSKEEFASSLKSIIKQPKPRALIYDEANINKRDALSKWNKDILDLYFSCRGLNIFHIWCNPSLQTIDKVFLEDRLRSVIIVRGKQKKKPRFIYYFRKADLLKIYKKYDNLDLQTIIRVRKKYAWFRGWFKDYNGILKQEYLEKKDNRMKVKVDQFFDKYADDEYMKRADVIKKLGCSDKAVMKHTPKLVLGKDYFVSITGRYSYSDEGIEKLRVLIIDSARQMSKNIRQRFAYDKQF